MSKEIDKKPDCYNCSFRGTVPGSAHSSCKYLDDVFEEPDLSMMKTALSIGMASLKDDDGNEPVTMNETGINGGWAAWPLDYDPIWVDKCVWYAPINTEEDGESN